MGKTKPPETGLDDDGEWGYRTTDVGNAKRLVDKHKKDLRFCDGSNSWFFWDGTRWQADRVLKVNLYAQGVIDDIFKAALTTRGATRTELIKHATRSENTARIAGMVKEAKPLLPIECEKFDADPYLLNVLNGTLHLRGKPRLHLHRRGNYLSNLAPVEYDPEAKARKWEQFLYDVFQGDAELIAFVQRALGSALTGDTGDECFFFCHGDGSNGKTTLFETMHSVLGKDYGFAAPLGMLTEKTGQNGPTPEVAILKGKRFVTTTETAEGKRLAEVMVKYITGGDTITARFLYGNPFSFKGSHHIFFGANYKPIIRGRDYAIWRRIYLIPFRAKFVEGENRVHKMSNKLALEAPGILNWLIEGCRSWQKDGLQPPRSVLRATRAFRKESDQMTPFIEDCLTKSIRGKVDKADMNECYQQWCKTEGVTPEAVRTLSRRLKQEGFQERKSHGKRLWSGVELCQ